MRLSAITRALNRHRLAALVIVLVGVLTGLGGGMLLGDRGSMALAPSDEPIPRPTTQTTEPTQTEGAMPVPSAPPTREASPSTSTWAVRTPEPTPSFVATSHLPVEIFAEVVADRLVMRVAPGLGSETAIPRLTAIYCLGGQELTLRGYYTEDPDRTTITVRRPQGEDQ
jgi:hypothetical protein